MKNVPYRTLALLAVISLIILVPFGLFGSRVDAWTARLIAEADAHRLYTGLALTLLLAVDIVMPVPSSLVSTACGMTLGFFGGACASFCGMTLSAAAGYVLGRYASCFAGKLIGPGEAAWLKAFQERHGVWVLLALRPVPVLAEASVVFSGLSRQPLPRVLAVTALGNLAVSAVYAAVGAWGRSSSSFLIAFGVSLLIAGLLMACGRLRKRTGVTPPSAAR